MKYISWLIIGFILIGSVFAECQELPGTGIIDSDIKLCSDTFDAPEGIQITSDNIELDCGTAVIRGNYLEKIGIKIENRKNVTVTRCNILTFNVGVFISNSSNIHLYDNALLKNDVGVRMYNSYENLIEKHNDKSNLKPVSALNSKFNTVILGNKNIDRDFCEENACNTDKDMNPCVDADFYCSSRCTPETDSDCRKKIEKITAAAPVEETPEVQEEIIEEENIVEEGNLTDSPKEKTKNSRQILAYVLFYFIGFLAFQFIRYVKRFDIEDL
jgi:parallel beta-helix repeat protein